MIILRNPRTALPTLVLLALLSSQACLPSESTLCRRCEPGGCQNGLVCTPRTNGAVCAPTEGLAACPLDSGIEPDAGTQDAGPADAGPADAGPPDAGPMRCPATGTDGIVWLYSPDAELCFAKTEVTVRQFETCGTTNCDESTYSEWFPNFSYCNLGKAGHSLHPMVCITQQGAEDFCQWAGGRLPTEAEWVAEATAGGTRTFPWGEELPTCERVVMNDTNTIAACDEDDSVPPCSRTMGNSISGLCDMIGNVRDITSDLIRNRPIGCGGDLGHSRAQGFLSSECVDVSDGFQPLNGFRCVRPPL